MYNKSSFSTLNIIYFSGATYTSGDLQNLTLNTEMKDLESNTVRNMILFLFFSPLFMTATAD